MEKKRLLFNYAIFYKIHHHSKYLHNPKMLQSLVLSLTFCQHLILLCRYSVLLVQGHTNLLIYIFMSGIVTEEHWHFGLLSPVRLLVQLLYMLELQKEVGWLRGKWC